MDDQISEALMRLNAHQKDRVARLVNALADGTEYRVFSESDFATPDFAIAFGDLLIEHHLASLMPLAKDKFEYALVDALNEIGHYAIKAPNGNPGEDIIVDGVPWSLKTQADKSIKNDQVHISKFMELGKGKWETAEDMIALRQRMIDHMTKYDRIFSLRCFRVVAPKIGLPNAYFKYELIEIPKSLLAKSVDYDICVQSASRQTPKPAYCNVEVGGRQLFRLYFDGGTERKLQVKNLLTSECVRHAEWKLEVMVDI